ncbi:MAG: hypothetical protein OXG26_09785 [Caldilineaceae bacterium]|nr:hypothetical protein [Caldilineaceae bacterium]
MKQTLVIIGLLALLIPGVLLAQEELTLDGLADQLTALENRLGALEAMFADPWSPNVIHMDDGVCQNPLHSKSERGDFIQMEMRQETADAYRTQYGTSIDPSLHVYLSSISFDVDSSNVYIQYTTNDRTVVEKWAHCEFLGHSEWEAAK